MSTRNAVSVAREPRASCVVLVAANRITKSAWSAWLMKCLVPLMTKSPPVSTAVVLMARRSEPAPGSVIARQSTRSPRTDGSR